jgi:hypothetical protein
MRNNGLHCYLRWYVALATRRYQGNREGTRWGHGQYPEDAHPKCSFLTTYFTGDLHHHGGKQSSCKQQAPDGFDYHCESYLENRDLAATTSG